MDLTCKVVSILPEQSFTGRQGEFVRFGFVGETQGQYPKKVKFDVLGKDKWEKLSPFIVLGSDVQVFFDVTSREYNGKWFTQCDAYRVSVVSAGASATAQAASVAPAAPVQSAASPAADAPDALPF